MTHQSERVLTRGVRLEQERAIDGARNPGDSKYGSTLYKLNSSSNKRFSNDLSAIEKQLKRSHMHIDQEKRQFLLKHKGAKPLLIVHRPPSPLMMTKFKAQQYDDEEYHSHTCPDKGPRYMKPLRSKVKGVNMRPTIDAFCVKTKKKVNLWESPMLEKEKPSFKSTVMPSWPLTASEVEDLVDGMEQHKALDTREEQSKALVVFDEKKTKKKSRKKSPKHIEWKTPPTTTSTADYPVADFQAKDSAAEWHFVTEAPISSLVTDEAQPSYPKPKRDIPRAHTTERSQKLGACQAVETDRSDKQNKAKALDRSKNQKKYIRPGYTGQTSEPQQNAICVTHQDVSNMAETSQQNGTHEGANTLGTPNQRPEQTTVSENEKSNRDTDECFETPDPTTPVRDVSKQQTEGEGMNGSRDQTVTSPSDAQSPARRVSGLEIILEAAIEGLN